MKLKDLIQEDLRAEILKGMINVLFQIHKKVYFAKNKQMSKQGSNFTEKSTESEDDCKYKK